MNSIQQFLVIGGLFLLGILILNINNSKSMKSDIVYNNEALITGTGAGQTLIDQIMNKAFDQKTVSGPVANATLLTSASNLGKDTGENNSSQFNDIDDYDNYSTVLTLGRLGNFNVSVKVYYVSYNYPDTKSSMQTFLKRIDVTVTNSLLSDKLVFSQLVSY